MENPVNIQYIRAKRELNGSLYDPYQTDGVMWMLRRENENMGSRGGFLCDEMGLGKTVQVVSTILGNPKGRSLIVVPKSIITQWKTEIAKFAPQLNVHVFDGPKRNEKENLVTMSSSDIVISPYSVLTKYSELHRIQWDRIVLDEAHEIRNKSSVTYKSICKLDAMIKWVVTGTPVFNSMKDFVSLCKFIGIPQALIQGRTEQIRELYILRRTKTDVTGMDIRHKLPVCHFENVGLEMYEGEKNLYNFAFKDIQDKLREIFKNAASLNAKNMIILECLLRARQCMIWPQMYLSGIAKQYGVESETWTGKTKKMETLFNMLESHPEEKSLVFCQFMGEMKHIQDNLKQRGIPVFRIDGTVSKENRDEQIKLFKEASPNAVFIIQIKSGGQGLNLQQATRVYIMSPSWNPATELQAIGRSHRSGQTKPVYVKKLFYKRTEEFASVDEEMMALQAHKSVMCSEILNDERLKTQIPFSRISKKINILDVKKIFTV